MKHFCIISNEQKDENLTVTNELKEYILGKGGICDIYVSSGSGNIDPSKLNNQVECIIALGGDGTLIRAARDLAETHIPLIGLNLGTLGFLCELELDTVKVGIDQIFQDNYVTESRIMLKGLSEGKTRFVKGVALNDIVLHRSNRSQIVNFILYVNGEYLNSYNADGMIISTPTGSTGYNLSAGGPIVDPNADIMIITPINPHAMNNKSIVVGGDASIVVEIGERKSTRDEEASVTFDGDTPVILQVGERITVHRAPQHANILKLNNLSFVQNLRKKMQEYR